MTSILLNASSDFGKKLAEAFLPEKINIFGLDVGPSMITALFVTFFLLLIALIINLTVIKRMKNVPNRFQAVLEMIVRAFSKMAMENTETKTVFLGAYLFAGATFICISTLVDLWGIRPAFADINTCFAFGISSFILINIYGYKKKGVLGRIGRYKNPILIITDIAVPISLSIRLFGSILSGFLIMRLTYSFLVTSFVFPAGVALITTLLHAFIQAYVFVILTTLFISEAIE